MALKKQSYKNIFAYIHIYKYIITREGKSKEKEEKKNKVVDWKNTKK